MRFGAKHAQVPSLPLKTFALKLRDGFLIGMGVEPEQGSPCVRCAEIWLTQRRVWVQRVDVSELSIRRELLTELQKENSPHVFYEISSDGTSTRLDCLVFPHPECTCRKEAYLPPATTSGRTNFAFSPVYQIKCARYGTPNGNLWLTSAAGMVPEGTTRLQVYAADRERENSRFAALDEWLKRAAFHEMAQKAQRGEPIEVENFNTGSNEPLSERPSFALSSEGLGAGASREDAILSALHSLAMTRTLRKFSGSVKSPMLVVGTNNWVRGRVPFFLLQQYDLHLLFYPNSTPSWVVGVAAISRVKTDEPPIFVFASGPDVLGAVDGALFRLLEKCRPADWKSEDETKVDDSVSGRNSKMHQWWTNWIYRCPKIALKDILHLEPYEKDLSLWRRYFGDGQERLSILGLNTTYLPTSLRYLVKLNAPAVVPVSRNVRGIGTWTSFIDLQ